MKIRGAHIAVHEVSHRYARGTETVLDQINLQVQPGESLALVGRSGCGKSTLLHLISGLSQAYQGQVEIDGAVVRAPSPEWIMMFQSPCLYPWMTVQQNIGLGLKFAGRSDEIKDRVADLLDLVQLPGFDTRNVQDLSGGQQQRVALARSLATDPRVLLLDEPFSALDAFTRQSLQHDVRQIAREKQITMVFVTHDVTEAVVMADRAIVMQANPGRIAAEVSIRPNQSSIADAKSIEAASAALQAAYEQAVGERISPSPPAPDDHSHGVTPAHPNDTATDTHAPVRRVA
ncbi:MAG: ABC transporter ATP-binding protein [Burkholderiaceae bacterium]